MMLHSRRKAVIGTVFLTFLFLLFFLLQPAYSHHTARLVTGDNYKPFTDQTLPQGGMITEIVGHVFEKMGYHAHIEFHSWSRGYSLSKEGEFMGTFPYVKTPERMEEFYFSDPIFTVTNLFFVREDADISFVHDSDLKGLTACKPLGYGLKDIQTFIDQDLIEVQRPNTVESCFRMLHRGRVDLVPINVHVGWEAARQIVGQEKVFRVLDRPLLEEGLYFIVTKKNPQGLDLVEQFNKILRQMRDESTLDAIIDRHMYSE